jgi:hypothetical protein
MPLPLAPDAAVVLSQALAGQADLVALVSDRVYTGWPEYQLYPMILVSVVDQLELDAECHSARVQVDCWGQGLTPADETESALIARTVVSVSRDLRGAWPAGHITNSAPLTFVAAPSDGWWRYSVDVFLELYP